MGYGSYSYEAHQAITSSRAGQSAAAVFTGTVVDPKMDPKAERYDRLTHEDAIRRELKVMDATAFALARENRMPIIVFSIREPGAIAAVLGGKGRATFVG